MKKIILALMIALMLGACTKQFEDANKNPYEISGKSLLQDFNNIGSYFPGMLALQTDWNPAHSSFWGNQISENLVYESYTCHLATATPFHSDGMNPTYYITWNSCWGDCYGGIMPESQAVLRIAKESNMPVFGAWATLIRIIEISRTAAIYGPVIYSNYGSSAGTIHYDKESDLYNTLFAQLDTVVSVFTANKDYAGLKNFDASYHGNVAQWTKVANTLRLQLAIRISEVAKDKAKTEGQKAISDPGGLIVSNSDNLNISLYGGQFTTAIISNGWDDTRMDAAQESFLVGLKDGRIGKFFAPCDASVDISDHPAYPYKGVRQGAKLVDKKGNFTKSARAPICSKISPDFNSITFRRLFQSAQTEFCLAEAALRGWTGAGNAQTHYENGVKNSFSDWGASGVDAYLLDAVSKPINYTDPVSSPINDFTSRSNITVAWNEGDSNEMKLEKIITQKWIDCFTNTLESWCDLRRTGYPKLPFIYDNESRLPSGVVPPNTFIQRMPFDGGELTGNTAAVTEAASWLRGGDFIGSPLWFVPSVIPGSNF